MPKSKKAKRFHPNQSSNNASGTSGELSHAEIWDDSALIRSWNEAVKEYEYYHSLAAQGLDVDAVLDEAEAAETEGKDVPLALPVTDSAELPESGFAAAANTVTETDDTQYSHRQYQGGLDGGADVEEGEVSERDNNDEHHHHHHHHQAAQHATPAAANDARQPTAAEREAALRRLGVLGQDGDGASQSTITTRAKKATATPATVVTEPLQPSSSSAPISKTTDQDQLLENVKMAYYWAGYYSGLYDGQRSRQGAGDNGCGG